MPIVTNYKVQDKTIENARLRIERLWGSKKEGWNAWMAVRAQGNDAVLHQYHVTASYIEGADPYKLLYKKAEEDLGIFKTIEVKTDEPKVESTIEQPKKKGRSKKN